MALNKIIRLIEESEKTIYQIAKEAGVDYALVHRIIHNKTKNTIRLDTAFKLADAIGVDINEFREEQENE